MNLDLYKEDMFKELKRVLLYLNYATTKNFSKGGDKPVRQRIEKLITKIEKEDK